MGHHFVPQAHLRRFQCPVDPGSIWMYDQERCKVSKVGIKNVAQARDYYHPEVEAGLAEDIESPANYALEKLIRQEKLDNKERSSVSLYLLTMATRGPRQRRKMLEELAPNALQEVLAETEAFIQQRIDETNGSDSIAIQRMAELHVARQKFSKALPENIVELIRTPFWSENTVECVHNMVWRVMAAPPGTFYVTGDTPVHISSGAGVGTPESELTFPISKDLALIGSHTGQPATVEYVPSQSGIVEEINRRIFDCFDRFVFAHTESEWIAQTAKNPPPIRRIQWGHALWVQA